ncbi:DUF4197 domain-containing protein, partial [Xanthovirga aplysinae]|uniref:DUF4197 domain-containing protein n=1 Tax=Xanthovirga aplysinae TaxID=2529853 RepID=UPI0012BCCA1E
FLKKVAKAVKGKNTGFSEGEASQGLKEALIKGTEKGVELVSKENGFLNRPEIKIPFPEDAIQVEKKLRAIGLGKEIDKVVTSLNRAAEHAAEEAKPIFVAAITSMTIKDAINIVGGPDDAATQYLNRTTSPELNNKFRPVIESSLEKVNATKYWEDVISRYNKIPLVKKVNPDLTEYVTQKAIEGLFVMIAKEEKAIRQDPVARTSAILKKVFGNNL